MAQKVAEAKKGKLIIISGPSGVGKGTICDRVLESCTYLIKSISVTTRNPRAGEADGKNYFFKTVEEYNRIKSEGGFLETFEIYGNYYGTPLEFVKSNIEKGFSVILEIDVQGGMAVKKKMPEATLIFIAPPSIEQLKSRLKKRNTEDEASYNRRIDSAEKEIEKKNEYDYTVINDEIEKAVSEVMNIIQMVTSCTK